MIMWNQCFDIKDISFALLIVFFVPIEIGFNVS